MQELVRNLARQRRLLRDLVRRDLKARYVGSSMGFFWSVVYPIINLAIYSFVFRLILSIRWDDRMPAQEAVLIMFAGILVWAAFAETLSRSTNSLVENSHLIQKVVFPSEVLSPYLAISSIVNMSIGLPIVLAGVAWFGYVAPVRPAENVAAAEQSADAGAPGGVGAAECLDQAAAPCPACGRAGEPVEIAALAEREGLGQDAAAGCAGSQEAPVNPAVKYTEHRQQEVATRHLAFGPGLLALPLLVGLQIVFTVGLGYLLSAFNLLVRDTVHVIGVLVTVWMFATPIFYPPALVSVKGFGWMLAINPMHWLITCYRDVLLYGQFPSALLVGGFAAVAAVVFALGASFFQGQKHGFPDLL